MPDEPGGPKERRSSKTLGGPGHNRPRDESHAQPGSSSLGGDHRSMQLQLPLQTYVTNKMELAKRTQATILMASQLASFVPDYVLYNDFPKITYDTTLDAVAFICDVSGFTALTEAYSLRGKGGTELLTKTISGYMNPLVECILKAGGDIIKYAGDAFLAVWRVYNGQFRRELMRVIDCALYIQEAHGSVFCADVDVTIRVKIGIGAGTVHECVIGNAEYHLYLAFGPGVEDASDSEHRCEKGEVVLSPFSFDHLVPTSFNYIRHHNGFIKVTEIISYPEGEPRGRPLEEKGKQVKPKDIRPAILAAIERKGVEQLRPFVIPPVHKILDANMPLDYLNESRQTSICFIKVELKPFDPKGSYVDTMLGYVQKCFRIIFDSGKLTGGSLTKIIMFDKGLTYLVAFGLPGYLHSNQSANALEFSHRVKGHVLQLKGVTEISLGVTTGTTYCGLLGHPKRQEYTVMGQMVNKAARLMCYYPGCVSCDQDTLFHSKRPIHHFSILPKKTLKGISSAGNIYEYLGAEVGEDQTVKSYEYPIVNRDSELKFFRAVIDSAVAEFLRFIQAHRIQGDYDLRLTKEIHAQGLWMLVVEGDVGMGKSRLLSAYVQEVTQMSNIMSFSLTMTMLLKEPLGAIRSLLYQALDLEGLVSMNEKEEYLRKVSNDDPELVSGLCLLNELINVKFPFHPKYQMADVQSRHVYAQHIAASLLRRIWTEKLLLFAIDDAHLMDPQSWDYLFYLSHSPHVMVVMSLLRTPSGTPRLEPSVSHILYGQKNVKILKLTRMDVAHLVPLACQMMEVFAIPYELEKILIAKSNGNPAWIDQVLSEMLRTGLLRIVPYDLRDAAKRKLKLATVNPKYIRRLDSYPKKRMWDSVQVSSFNLSVSSSERRASSSLSKLDRPSKSQKGKREQKQIESAEERMCVVKSETNLSSTPIPGTLKEILLDQFDEFNSSEQLLLKCASVLGPRFGRQMLICLIPMYEVNAQKYENGFKRMMEAKVIRCASAPRSHGRRDDINYEEGKGTADCFCRFTKPELQALETHAWYEDTNRAMLQYPNCKFMQFTKDSLLEVVYELLTEDQRKEMHLRAAQYLDTSIIRCGVHGGIDTSYQFGFVVKGSGDVGGDHEEALRQAASQGKRRHSFYGAAQAVVERHKLSDDLVGTDPNFLRGGGANKKPRQHETQKHDTTRKLYGSTSSSNIPLLEFSILQEMNRLDDKDRAKRQQNSCCRRKSNKFEEPNEYELEIKKLVVAKDGRGDMPGDRPPPDSDAASYSGGPEGPPVDQVKSEVVDIRGCTCTNIQAKVCLEMVKHYRQAEKYGKCLVNLLDAAECAVTIGNSGQALIHLEDAEALVAAISTHELAGPKAGDPDDLPIDEEEVAIQVEFLNGLTYFELGIHLKAREFFLKSLKRFGLEIPNHDDKVKISTEMLFLNSRLWRRHNWGTSDCCRFDPGGDGGDEVDPSVSLKLRILTYLQVLYKVDRKYDMALLMALWQVLTAEKGSGSYQDILPAYCTMMETYCSLSDHKRAAVYERLALKEIRLVFSKLGIEAMPPLGLYSVAAVFSAVTLIRCVRGEIASATDAAYLSLRIARTMHDNAIAMQVYPRIVVSLLMGLRISEVIEVLQKLWYTSEEEEDWNGTSLYWTLCLNLLLYTAYPMEPYAACEHFVTHCEWGADLQLFRMYEIQFNIESSIALWNARFDRWEMATKWIERAVKSKPKIVNYLTVEGQLKLLECELMFVNHFLEAKRYQHFAKSRSTAKQLMTSLEINTQRVPVLQPRFLHLMAYYCRISSRIGESDKYLRKAEKVATSQGNLLEIEWIAHNRTVWNDTAIPTIKYFWIEHVETNSLNWHQSSSVPWSNIMFSLPLPAWK